MKERLLSLLVIILIIIFGAELFLSLNEKNSFKDKQFNPNDFTVLIRYNEKCRVEEIYLYSFEDQRHLGLPALKKNEVYLVVGEEDEAKSYPIKWKNKSFPLILKNQDETDETKADLWHVVSTDYLKYLRKKILYKNGSLGFWGDVPDDIKFKIRIPDKTNVPDLRGLIMSKKVVNSLWKDIEDSTSIDFKMAYQYHLNNKKVSVLREFIWGKGVPLVDKDEEITGILTSLPPIYFILRGEGDYARYAGTGKRSEEYLHLFIVKSKNIDVFEPIQED